MRRARIATSPWRCPCCEGGGDAAAPGRREVIRAAIGLGLAGAAAAAVPGAALAQLTGGAPRRIALERLQTGESFEGVYWQDGRYDREALRQLDWVLRDPAMDEPTPMDPRLFDLLYSVARRLDADEPFEVISGYRAPETNATYARRSRRVSGASLHMYGMAADVRLPGRDSYGLARLAAAMQTGGVGLYRRDGFVHLDCGPARRW